MVKICSSLLQVVKLIALICSFSFPIIASAGPGEELYFASLAGNIQAVQRLLESGVFVDYLIEGGLSPLYIAAQKGYFEVVELLLSKGASIDLATINGATPLYVATENGQLNVVELLLSKGAFIDYPIANGGTPLFAAVEKGYSEVVELLLKKKALVNRTALDGETPLHVAATMTPQSKAIEIIPMLLERGANPHQKMTDDEDEDDSPLALARAEGRDDAVEIMTTYIREREVRFEDSASFLRN